MRELTEMDVQLQAEAAMEFMLRGGDLDAWFKSKCFAPFDRIEVRRAIDRLCRARREH